MGYQNFVSQVDDGGGGRGCQRGLGGEEGIGRKSVGRRRGVAGNIGEVWGGVML